MAERDRFADGEEIDPRWVSFLISKPPLVDASMPGWVRVLQPLLSGVFTVDNLDYVRRDAYLTGVSMGPVDAERLRRYTFVSERGLTLYESGIGALEMFLTARLFMYQHVYLHRTVRAIDLDLAEVFAPSIRAVFGDGSPGGAAGCLRGSRRVRPAPPGGRLGARRAPHRVARAGRRMRHRGGRGRLARDPAPAATLARRARGPRRIRDRRVADRPAGGAWRTGEPGRVVVDLTGVDARPGASKPPTLAIERRDGGPGPSLADALSRLPAWLLIGRRYRRVASSRAVFLPPSGGCGSCRRAMMEWTRTGRRTPKDCGGNMSTAPGGWLVQQGVDSMCLFAILAGMFPRVAFLIYWIARPSQVDAAFDTFIIPLLGFIFLPFTTLMYVILWTPGVGITGTDWLWIGLAALLDIGHYTYSAYGNRDQIPGMSSGQ